MRHGNLEAHDRPDTRASFFPTIGSRGLPVPRLGSVSSAPHPLRIHAIQRPFPAAISRCVSRETAGVAGLCGHAPHLSSISTSGAAHPRGHQAGLQRSSCGRDGLTTCAPPDTRASVLRQRGFSGPAARCHACWSCGSRLTTRAPSLFHVKPTGLTGLSTSRHHTDPDLLIVCTWQSRHHHAAARSSDARAVPRSALVWPSVHREPAYSDPGYASPGTTDATGTVRPGHFAISRPTACISSAPLPLLTRFSTTAPLPHAQPTPNRQPSAARQDRNHLAPDSVPVSPAQISPPADRRAAGPPTQSQRGAVRASSAGASVAPEARESPRFARSRHSRPTPSSCELMAIGRTFRSQWARRSPRWRPSRYGAGVRHPSAAPLLPASCPTATRH
jgi:hypothetical protein